MASAGFSSTGAVIYDFDHVKESIGIILSTPVGTRVMRREFGSELLAIIDRPMCDSVLLAAYAAVVSALSQWEPRYRVTNVSIDTMSSDGAVAISLTGIYYPRGHLGDYTVDDGAESVVIPIASVS